VRKPGSNTGSVEFPDTLLHVGVSKSGKTYALQRELAQHAKASDGPRFMVLDRLGEWPGHCDADHALCSTTADAKASIRDGNRLTIVQPPRSFEARTSGDLPELAEGFAKIALEYQTILVLPESHLYAPKVGKLHPYMTELVTAYRHYGAGFWADSQRFAQVHEHVVSQSETQRFFAMRSESDRKRARDEGGRDLEAMIIEALKKLGDDDPGWHVRIGKGAPYPYVLERFED